MCDSSSDDDDDDGCAPLLLLLWLLLLLLPPHQTTEGFRTELKKAEPVLPCELAAKGNCCCGTKVPPSGCSDGAGIGMARALLHERSVRVVRTTTATATWMRAVRLRRRGLARARCGPFRREGRPHRRIRSGCSCHHRDCPLYSYRCSRCDNNPSRLRSWKTTGESRLFWECDKGNLFL